MFSKRLKTTASLLALAALWGCSDSTMPTAMSPLPASNGAIQAQSYGATPAPETVVPATSYRADATASRYSDVFGLATPSAAGEEFNCQNVQEVFVRFSEPGYVLDNAAGLFVSYTGLPAGQKLVRVWWDYENQPGAFEDRPVGEGEVRRDDDTLFDYTGVIEHGYTGLAGPTDFRVRVEMIVVGKTGNCARVRDATVQPGTRTFVKDLVNGSFETGNFTGWVAQDLSSPYYALSVRGPGQQANAFSSFISAPTDGSFAALTGFDGNGPGRISLGQLLTVPNTPSSLRFDYRAGWDMTYGATQNRSFSAEILSDSGNVLATQIVLTAPAGNTTNDTGNLSSSVSLTAFQGDLVFVRFVWDVPQNYTGPGFFQLDNVRLTSP